MKDGSGGMIKRTAGRRRSVGLAIIDKMLVGNVKIENKINQWIRGPSWSCGSNFGTPRTIGSASRK